MDKQPTTNGWGPYEKLVLFRLDQQDVKLDALTDKMEKLQQSMVWTKVKITMLSGLAGTIGSAIAYAFFQAAVK